MLKIKKYIVGITGASGSVLAQKILGHMAAIDAEVHIIVTDNGERVFQYELGMKISSYAASLQGNAARFIVQDNQDLFASVASGSYGADAMVIVPCSMATVGKLASCTGSSLLCRAADVMLKERKKLVLVPRETPLHSVHLKNLLTLSELGAVILPPMPLFYAKPENLDEMLDGIAGRILKSMDIENILYLKWGT